MAEKSLKSGKSAKPGKFSDIGRKLSRLFLGRIVVRSLGDLHREEPTRISSHFHAPDIHRMRSEPRIGSALFVKWKKTRPRTAGSILGRNLLRDFKVSGIPFEMHMKSPVKKYKFNIAKRATAKNGMWRMKRFPQIRSNRLNYLKVKPKFERATLLALYSPLFQAKVKKSALDKASGNLLLWYDSDRIKLGERHHLLLLRVFGGDEPLRWVWLPADKKLS